MNQAHLNNKLGRRQRVKVVVNGDKYREKAIERARRTLLRRM